MAKYYLVGSSVKRTPHTGLIVTAYYKQNPENPLEQPQRLVVFNRWPPVEMEAEVVTIPLNGIYETTSGHKIDHITPLCPTTINEEGKRVFWKGYNPEERLVQALHILKRVDD